MQWQPIETAPKDGTEILIFEHGQPFGYDYAIGRWSKTHLGGWSNRNSAAKYINPTHWMPLPAPPEASAVSGDRSAEAEPLKVR